MPLGIKILLIVIALIVLLLLVLIIKAASFKPKKSSSTKKNEFSADKEKIAQHFSSFLKCQTVSIENPDSADSPEHEKFIKLIMELYPKVFAKCEFERVLKFGLVLKFKGKSDKNPVCIMSHYDVVPVTKENWSCDPFGGLIKDGFVWGRGAIDNKATLLCSMEAMEKVLTENPDFTPLDDIYFTFGGDEEIAGKCQQAIVEKFEKEGKEFKLVLDEGGAIVNGIFPGVKEDTAVIGLCEKGIANVELSVGSTGGHASTPSKDNPVNVLARALVALEKNPMKACISSPVAGMLDTLGRYSSFGLKIVFANMWLFSGLVKKIFTKGNETNAMLTTTFAYTTLNGSKAHNVLPSTASCNINIRINNNTNIDEVISHIKQVINDDRVKIDVKVSFNPSPVAKIEDYGYSTVKEIMNEVYPDVIVSPYVMLAASDSRFYKNLSSNTLKFAPFRLSKAQRSSVHGDDEKISVDALYYGTNFYYNLIKTV